MLAPILLFAFSRPDHTRRALAALAANELADQSDLIVYADGARNEREAASVRAVRELVRGTTGFRSVTLIERDMNFGLARNIIEGVSEVLCQHERVIVLEDDLVTSPFFLTYMNEALERYANDDRIISIHGYVYPVAGALPEAFFLPGADCWGWATWRRGWAYFNPNGAQLLLELKQRKLEHAFNYGGSFPYTQMLEAQIAGTNDSWAIRWYASAFLLGKLTLYPGRSLVHNIGNDASGMNCGQSSVMDTSLSDRPIRLDSVAVESCAVAQLEIARFFSRQSRRGISGWTSRLLSSLIMERNA
jgi:hypothetical protein